MINQLSYVTKKLQHQSLDESHENGGASKAVSEDKDSGTESDDERTYDEPEIAASEMSSEVSSGCSVRSRPTSQTSTDTLTCDDLPSGGDAVDMPPPSSTSLHITAAYSTNHPPHPLSKRTPRNSATSTAANTGGRHSSHRYMLRTSDTSGRGASPSSRVESPIEGLQDSAVISDYDGCDPNHSSEEELETLTGQGWLSGPPEKRKWSQVAAVSLTDSGSSDDEVCVLTTGTPHPLKFRTSPPLQAHKPLRSASPPSKMLTLACKQRQQQSPCKAFSAKDSIRQSPLTEEGAAAVVTGHQHKTEAGVRAASPRKRHRHSPRPYRPSLDFEKMQQMKTREVNQWRNGGELSLSFF